MVLIPKTMEQSLQLPRTVMQDTEGLHNMVKHHVAPHSQWEQEKESGSHLLTVSRLPLSIDQLVHVHEDEDEGLSNHRLLPCEGPLTMTVDIHPYVWQCKFPSVVCQSRCTSGLCVVHWSPCVLHAWTCVDANLKLGNLDCKILTIHHGSCR